ncbi:MAG: branched-chain-amino-acid transaminase [Spirochaetaceae bacterium]|jgi:branched-chain amino acid aminotransferase|nr:branched-chain-amino-acid transaminase [Spirochaetaceae bacterium]
MAFTLSMFPVSYVAHYDPVSGRWKESWIQKDAITEQELAAMDEQKRSEVLAERNRFDLPLVNYTTQYGFGCFEGMKAYPRKDGSVALFRPDRNAARFRSSMEGLYAPGFPEDMFVQASVDFIRRNAEFGYVPRYNPEWETDSFAAAQAVYMRPFMYSEGAIGIGISKAPSVIITASSVSSYFSGENTKAVTTERIRATPKGTGNIKCASNYVISALAKKEAENAGYMEVIFLDAVNHRYVEEGSSCNIFFLLRSGELVTPELGDTILPGITRASIIDLARGQGVAVVERKIQIKEAMTEAVECFVTGTAAGITPVESITHQGREAVFNNRKPGELGMELQRELKGLQYGLIDDTKGWLARV